MNRGDLINQLFKKKSCLCIGLDTDPDKIPTHLLSELNPVLAFNQQIIDATQDLCVAYKINSAFYEAQGEAGWATMQETLNYIPDHCLKILDAKRGDIGNTSDQYARAAYDVLQADAVTLAPYMGQDSIDSFLKYENKWAIILALTSNPSSQDFELLKLSDGRLLYEAVIDKIKEWGTADQMMMVVGATQTDLLRKIRLVTDPYFLLIPGVGAQGASLSEVMSACWIEEGGMLINSSRGIIYAGSGPDFAHQAQTKAAAMVAEMSPWF